MRYAFAPLALGLGANALVARSSTQCYKLKASGSLEAGTVAGILGQLSDGQNRIGGNLPQGCYCISNGGFTDSSGRGCIVTPPTGQFQCDAGASPTEGFAVGSEGSVTYNGSKSFWACPVKDDHVWNIYSRPVEGQSKCFEVSLSTEGTCGADNSSPKPEHPSSPQPDHPSTPSNSDTCPQNLEGSFQFPHLIVPINADHPDQAYGTRLNGTLDSKTCTIFNFDIPPSSAGKTCSTIFFLPERTALKTSSFSISGELPGHVTLTKLKGYAEKTTTWNNQPEKEEGKPAEFEVSPGGAWTAFTGGCEAGKRVAYEMCSLGDFALDYFQDFNEPPIGLFVREC